MPLALTVGVGHEANEMEALPAALIASPYRLHEQSRVPKCQAGNGLASFYSSGLLICLLLAALAYYCVHTCKASLDTTRTSHLCIPSTTQHERSEPARARGDDYQESAHHETPLWPTRS